MATLLHGTTRARADKLIQDGPDPRYCEPGVSETDAGFSLFLEAGPFLFGTPTDYAFGKARLFPNEGGPAILVVEVPESIIALTNDGWFPASQGLIQFDPGAGLEELLAVKRILIPECP